MAEAVGKPFGEWLLWVQLTMYYMGDKMDESFCSLEGRQDGDAALFQMFFGHLLLLL